MNIGLLGLGNIGSTLARRLPGEGHAVKVANSRGPETIDPVILSEGARAVTAEDAVRDVDVVILSLPLNAMPKLAELLATVPAETVIIDTSNYYPGRDGKIEALETGQIESEWVVDQLSRPIVKAWNAIGAGTLADRNLPAGHSDRIGIPIAGDEPRAKEIASALMNDSGFDPVDAGTLADSWRQQPGSPAYCTELTAAEVPEALAAARRDRLPKLRDFASAIFLDRMADPELEIDSDYGVRLNRMIYSPSAAAK